jgi:uncharacterized membrane protein YoaK (UPF0700 family)
MIDVTTAIISAVLAGLAGGFLHSWMAFNSTGEKFDGRKHGNAIITGALAGMGLGLALVIAGNALNKTEISPAVFAVGLFFIFLAAAGVDAYRSKASKMIANRFNKPESETETKTKTDSSPPSSASPQKSSSTTETK